MIRSRAYGAALLSVIAFSAADSQTIRTGSRAPEINLAKIDGGRVELSKLRGRPGVVSFWGSWCPPCREEFPELVRAHNAHADAGLFVLAVNGRDQEHSEKDVRRFLDAFPVPFAVVLDKRGSARRAYKIVGQPTTVFIDSSGVVRAVHTGLISKDELDRGIALILPRS